MSKLDFKKTQKELYTPPKSGFALVDVPAMTFLMMDGLGNPNTAPAFAQAVEALYALSYGVKFALKAEGLDYTVMPLEGLWWTPDMATFSIADKDSWHWTVMIRQPDQLTDALLEQVRAEKQVKKPLPALPHIRLERFAEGKAAQCLYVGPYADEPPVIARLHAFIADQGLSLRGKHHEIYLSDARRTAPERLKTILRQPVG